MERFRLNENQAEIVEQAQEAALELLDPESEEYNEECAALFDQESYNFHSPLWIIGQYSTYLNGRTTPECRRGGTEAWTNVGGRVVRLCDDFFTSSEQDRTRILIHEALHTAGQREHPQGRGDLPTPQEINQWVRDDCNL